MDLIVSTLTGIILVTTSLISPTPRSLGLGEWAYIFFVMCLVLFSAIPTLMRGLQLPKSYLYAPMLTMFLVLILSAWQAMVVNGVDPYLWLRGFIPFLNYFIFFPLVAVGIRRLQGLQLLVGALLVSSMIISTQIIITAVIYYPNWFMIRANLPEHAFQPHILASFGFLVGYATEIAGKKRMVVFLLALFFFVCMIITLSLSFLLIAIMMGLFAALKNIRRLRSLNWLMVLGCILLMIIVSSSMIRDPAGSFRSALVYRLLRQISDISETARWKEIEAVLEEFKKSPLFGNGLGYQYSYYRSAIDLEWTGGYTHNIVTYILLTTGLTGLMVSVWLSGALFLEIKVTYRRIKKARLEDLRALFWGIVFCLVSLMMYSLVQSIFRALAFPLIASVVLAGIVRMRRGFIPTTRG